MKNKNNAVVLAVLAVVLVLGLGGYLFLRKTNAPPATKKTDLTDKMITFLGVNAKVFVSTQSQPDFNSTSGSYILHKGPSTNYNVSFYENEETFENNWPFEYKDSDGDNAGTGSFLSSETAKINGLIYKKRYSYYNPINITKSGRFDPKISSILSTSCVLFLKDNAVKDNGVVIFFPNPANDGTDACEFLEKNVSIDIK